MSTAKRNLLQTFSYFIPVQAFRRSFITLSYRWTTNLWLTTSFLSLISNTTFAMSTATRISLRHSATSIMLIYFGDLYSSIKNLLDFELLAERQMPTHPFYNCISSRYDFRHKGFLSTQAGIKLLSWKPSISSFDSFIFPFNITRR